MAKKPMAGKWAPLYTFLMAIPAAKTKLVLKIEEIEKIIGTALSRNARLEGVFWQNSGTHQPH